MEGLGSKRALALTLFLDLGISLGSYLAAFRLRFLFTSLPAYNWRPFVHVLPVYVLLSLFVHAIFGVYQPHVEREEAQATSMASSFGNLLVAMAVSYLVGALAVPRSVLVIAAVIQALVLGLTHRRLTATFQRFPVRAYDLREIDPDRLAREVGADEVRVNPDPLTVLLAGAKLAHSKGYRLELALPSVGFTAAERALKRMFDLILLLVLLGPALLAMLLLGAAVAIGSGFPVLYTQERVGRLGRPFRVYKFRSMMKDAEEETGPVLAWSDDNRVTPVGRFLRQSRLDELPQFMNILRGEMSFVGPRPERPEFVRIFSAKEPYYSLRLRVKPGLTGLAQIYGSYDLPAEEKLKYDLYYLSHYSPALDFLILVRTLAVPLQPKKARGRDGVNGGRLRLTGSEMGNGPSEIRSQHAAAGKEHH